MTRERQKPRDLTMDEIGNVFVEMGLATETEREKILKLNLPISEQGETVITWIDASTGTAAWQLPLEEGNAELE